MLSALVVLSLILGPANPGKKRATEERRSKAKLAKVAFKEAEAHYKLGLFADALEDYTRAYELFEAPELLFNMAQCNFELKNYQRALFFFDRYIEARPDTRYKELIARRRATATKRIEEARAQAEAQARTAELEARLKQEQQAGPEWYEEWWFWTTVGVVVAGSATAFVLLQSDDFDSTLGELDRR